MSRREDRSFDSRRHRSRFDREPSPKRSRRGDQKLERESPKRSRRDDHNLKRERPPADTKLDKDRDSEMKHHCGLRDPLPLESPLARISKVETGTMSKDTDSRTDGPPEGTKKSSDQTNIPHSRSYLQHDDRASIGKNGRGLSRRTDKEGGWRDSKQHSNDRAEVVKKAVSDVKNEKPKDSRDENRAWRHDGYRQMEAHPKPPARKRPTFTEHKVPTDHEKTNKLATDSAATQKTQDRAEESGRRDRDEGMFDSERSERPRRPFVRESELARAEARGSSRDRHGSSGGGGRYRGGRERFNSGSRQEYHKPDGAHVEKWKHDLYDEANKSLDPKNEEDQISKIEALLAS